MILKELICLIFNYLTKCRCILFDLDFPIVNQKSKNMLTLNLKEQKEFEIVIILLITPCMFAAHLHCSPIDDLHK